MKSQLLEDIDSVNSNDSDIDELDSDVKEAYRSRKGSDGWIELPLECVKPIVVTAFVQEKQDGTVTIFSDATMKNSIVVFPSACASKPKISQKSFKYKDISYELIWINK